MDGFIIVGNGGAITYDSIFPLVKENKLWLGKSIHSGDRKFYVPDNYPLDAAGCGVDESGRRFIRVKGVRWWTNIGEMVYKESLDLVCKYDPDKYPKFDTYDAINVNKTCDIPCDYDGVMGVPITFFDKYCPEQFEIVGKLDHNRPQSYDFGRPIIDGKHLYARILIRRKENGSSRN